MGSGLPSFITLSCCKGRQSRPEVRLPSHTCSSKIAAFWRSFRCCTFEFFATVRKNQNNPTRSELTGWLWEAAHQISLLYLVVKAVKPDQKYDYLVTPTQTKSRHFGGLFAVASKVHPLDLFASDLANGDDLQIHWIFPYSLAILQLFWSVCTSATTFNLKV